MLNEVKRLAFRRTRCQGIEILRFAQEDKILAC